ncbi:MAG TPA: hypothetical protein VGR62_05535 [Candidatus Binatia bacterium]|jgi:hypothetical protein|nr:hypothetical protein [Candidatus Binatia bacterium]
MRVLVGGSLALLALLSLAPQASAQSCDEARFQLETSCPCPTAASKGKYVKCVKKAFGKKGALADSKACKKEIVKLAQNSICGRPTAAICCKAKGKKIGSVTKTADKCTGGKKPGLTCDVQSSAPPSSADGAFFNSVDDVCTDTGGCVTTTTTSTTTTSSTTTTTLLVCVPDNTCNPAGTYIDFTTSPGGGSCGTAESAGGATVIQLSCGGLNIGGGISTVLEGPTPDGATNRFLVDCTGDDCKVCPTTEAGEDFDCTDTGCNYGTPLPIENGGTSTCVVNTFATPACGNINRANGSTSNLRVNLASGTFLTGVPGSLYTGPDTVCPVCQVGGVAVNGTPASPATGTCNGGANAGDACSSTNSDGLTRDCPPGGVAADPNTCAPGSPCADGALNLGALAVDLTPLTTGEANKTAADSLFCPGQGEVQKGCFGRATDMAPLGFKDCATITEIGAPAGEALTPGVPKAVTLATVFCIPKASIVDGDIGGIVDLSANLPGPGATSLPGTLTFVDPAP